MKPDDTMLKRLRKEIQKIFFDLSADNVLIYQDPIIGQLANQDRQLTVVADFKKARFELRLRGNLEQIFAWRHGVHRACQEAFGAYFDLFESLCRSERKVAQAA